MAELENTEKLVVTVATNDQASGPAKAIGDAYNGMADKVERGTTVIGKARLGWDATNRSVDAHANYMVKAQQAQDRFERRSAVLEEGHKRQALSAEDLRVKLERLAALRDRDVTRAEEARRKQEAMYSTGPVDAYAQALKRAADAGQAIGKNLQNMMGNGLGASAFDGAGAVQRTREELEALRMEHDKVYRTSKQYEAALTSLGAAADALGLKDKALERIVNELNAAYTAQLGPMREINAENAKRAAEQERQVKAARDLQQAYNQERAALDQVFAAELRHQQQITRINDLESKGLNPDRAAGLRTLATTSHESDLRRIKEAADQVDSNGRRIGHSLGYQRQQMVNFFQQVQDFGVQIASGSGLFYPVVQQVPQMVSALGGASDAWTKFKGFVTSGAGAVTIAGAAIGGLGYIINSRIGEMNALSVRLRGLGEDALTMAKNVKEAGRLAANVTPGLSGSEATGLVEGYIRTAAASRLGGAVNTVQLVQDTADIAARIGTTVNDVFGRITQGMRDPTSLLDSFVKEGLLPMDAGFRANVVSARDANERFQSMVEIIERARPAFANAAKEGLSPLGAAMLELKGVYGDFFHDVGTFLEGRGRDFLKWLTDVQKAQNETARTAPGGDGALGGKSVLQILGEYLSGTTREQVDAGVRADPDFREGENLWQQTARRRAGSGYNLPATINQNQGFFDMLRPREGGADMQTAFNTFLRGVSVNGRSWTNPSPVPNGGLENMSISQVYEQGLALRRQQETAGLPWGRTSSAAGAYQITGSTMLEFADRLGIGRDEKFSRETQTALAQGIVDEAIRRANGDMNKAAENLRGRWAGLEGVSNEQIIRSLTIRSDGPMRLETNAEVAVTGENGAAAERGNAQANAARGIFNAPDDATISQWERLSRIVAGNEGYRPQMTTGAGRREELPAYITALEQGLANAPADVRPDVLDKAKNTLEEYRASLERAHDPLQRLLDLQKEQLDVTLSSNPAQAEFNKRMIEFDRARAEAGQQGRETLPEVRRQYASNLVRELSAPIQQSVQETDRAILSQDRLTAAYENGATAVGMAANRERALELVRKNGVGTTEAQADAVEELAAKYDVLQRRQNNDVVTKANDQRRVEMELMRAEIGLLGLGTTAREQELAAIKAASDARNRPGGTDEASVQSAARSAREATAVRQGLERQRAAYAEIENFGVQAFDRIGEAITQSLVTGEKKAIKFKDIFRGIISEMIQLLLKLAVMNPLKNWLTGSNNPTISDVGGALGSLFGGGGGGGVGAGGVGALGAVGSLLGGGGGGGSGGGLLGFVGGLFGGNRSAPGGAGAVGAFTSLMANGGYDIVPDGAGSSLTVLRDPGTNAAPAGSSGGLTGYGQQAMSAFGLYRNMGGGGIGSFYDRLSANNPSQFMTGSYDWTGNYSPFGSQGMLGGTGIGEWLNTPLWGTTGAMQGTATNAALNASTYGMGPATAGEVAAQGGSVAGSGGLTAGGAAAGALGIAGGAYGIYSGIQKGGVGGAFTAAGGAATAGLSAAAMASMSVPVYGWIAAAALTIIGALLPGQKPSDRTGAYTLNTLTGEGFEGGLDGKRFSQENRDQAKGVAGSLRDLAAKVGQRVGLEGPLAAQFRVGVGGREGLQVAIGNQNLQAPMDEEGIKKVTDTFTRIMLQQAAVQSNDPLLRNVINNTPGGDPEAIFANVDWYRNDYKQLLLPNDYERSINELRRKWQESIDKASSLGLPVDVLNQNLEKEIALLAQKRAAGITEYDAGIRQRQLAPYGGLQGQSGLDATIQGLQASRQKELVDFETQMSTLGLSGAERDTRRAALTAAFDADAVIAFRNFARSQEDRELQRNQLGQAPALRVAAAFGARGNIAAQNAGEAASFETSVIQGLVSARRALEDLGVSAADMAPVLAQTAYAFDLERENLVRTQARRGEDRSVQLQGAAQAPFLRLYGALGSRGDLGAQGEAERVQFEANAMQSLVAARRNMEDLGVSAEGLAAALSVSIEAINLERDNLLRTQARRAEDRFLQTQGAFQQPSLRLYSAFAARGDLGAQNEGERAQFEAGAAQSLVQVRRSLEDLGTSSEGIARQMAIAANAIDVERANLMRNQARRAEDRLLANRGAGEQSYLRLYSALGAAGNAGAAAEGERVQFETGAVQSLIQLRRQLEDLGWTAGDIAGQLGVATAAINVERDNLARTQARRAEDAFMQAGDLRTGLDVRMLNARGMTEQGGAVQFRFQIQQEELQLRRSMQDLGFSAEETALRLEQFGEIARLEGIKLQDSQRDQRAGTALGPVSGLLQYARGLNFSEASPLSVQSQLANARDEFQAISGRAAMGDFDAIGRVQDASQTYLGLAREVYGSGADYVTVFQSVTDAIAKVGDMSVDALTQSVFIAEGRTNTDRLVETLLELKTELRDLRTQVGQQQSAPLRLSQ